MPETLFGKEISSKIPLPLCIVNSKGKVVSANEHIGEVFIYDGIEDADFFALAFVVLHEPFTAKSLICCALITAGTLFMVL